MGVIFKIDQRRVIPRLRSFENSMKTGELDLTSDGPTKNNFNTIDYLSEQRASWKKNRNLLYAADLLSSAFVLGLESEFLDVAKFIIDEEPNSDSPLSKIAEKTLKIENVKLYTKLSGNLTGFNPQNYYREIRKLKYYLFKEPRNPITLIELGRIYSLLGQIEKAKKFIDRSLSLDKDNRFIVRSASRFYHHFFKDDDIALRIIKGSKFVNDDPWLLSADVAYSNILNRFSKMTKRGKQILESSKFNDNSITELASAIATVELSNGKNKDAKKYFIQSLKKPNDNSLAQAEWVTSTMDGLHIDNSKFDLPLAYEAKTIAAYEGRQYDESFKNALKWIEDETYSTRPVLTASYISGTFLNNNGQAIQLLKEGLNINHNDSKLNNNLVYFLALNNEVEEASKIFKNSLYKVLEDSSVGNDAISFIGTAGLIRYKEGNPEEGKRLYLRAMQMAEKASNEYLVALAMGNFLREELLVSKNPSEIAPFISKFKKMKVVNTEADIKLLFDSATTSYEKLMYTNAQ